jgi:hypothetical protein
LGEREITLDYLTPDPANARSHTECGVGRIEEALHEVGAARSIVIDEAGVVLAGNAIVEAAVVSPTHVGGSATCALSRARARQRMGDPHSQTKIVPSCSDLRSTAPS